MRFEASQHLRLGQQMKLAPKMIQSMEILQLAALALDERIDQELESNIALETFEPEHDAQSIADERREAERDAREGERELIAAANGSSADFERLDTMERTNPEAFDNEYSSYQSLRSKRQDGERDGKMDAMANAAARAESLTEQLMHQWALAEVDPRIRRAGEHLISYLDNDGYLRTEMSTIIKQVPPGVEPEDLDDALPAIQAWLEPTGIGARDLRECLLLQLDMMCEEEPDVDRSVERMLIEEYLPEIEKNRLPIIEQRSGLSIDQIKAGLEHIRRSFDPRPGRRLVVEIPAVVVPDAIVEYDEANDEYIAYLTYDRRPRLRVNPDYAKMAKDRKVDKPTREFVDGNVRDARWLIEAIDLRNNTVMRVIRLVLAHQRDFFDQGPQALKPLPMTQIADQLGIHVATVSRAVNGKWIQTPRGVLPLRKFFSAGTERSDGQDMSWEAVRETLREIIDAEDKAKPLGDDKLAKALEERGIKIARRTVAKYRDQLGIAPARLRKTF